LLIWPFVALGAWLGWQCSTSTPILIVAFACLSLCYGVVYWNLNSLVRRDMASNTAQPDQATNEA
jgi:mannose/fructose/N-acetylgalactosamine-specific phosphotransferase system component IIC